MKTRTGILAGILVSLIGLAGLQAGDGDLVYRASNRGTMTNGQANTFFGAFSSAAGSEPIAATTRITLVKCTVDGVQKYCWEIQAIETDTSANVKTLIGTSLSDPDYSIEIIGRCNAASDPDDHEVCD